MPGPDMEKFAEESSTIALAKCQVEFVHLVAQSLREMRRQQSISQAAMAKHLGVSQARIAQIESGRPGDEPSLAQIAAYAFVCDLPINLFFCGWTKPAQDEESHPGL